MNYRWILRASRWARNPPSLARVILVFSIVAACLALLGLEHFNLLPDWMALPTRGHGKVKMIPLTE